MLPNKIYARFEEHTPCEYIETVSFYAPTLILRVVVYAIDVYSPFLNKSYALKSCVYTRPTLLRAKIFDLNQFGSDTFREHVK
jgi:hypothetical protein